MIHFGFSIGQEIHLKWNQIPTKILQLPLTFEQNPIWMYWNLILTHFVYFKYEIKVELQE